MSPLLPINGIETPSAPVAELREAFPNLRWYALRVKTGRETAVSRSLQADAVPEFLPTCTKQVRWSDRTRTVERPLFPGYLFAFFNRTDPALIWATAGVLQILGTDETSSIPAGEIANLRTVCSSKSAKAVPYEAGLSRVRVVRGPFAGVEGMISRVKGTRLSIPVELLNRSVEVEIDAADTEEIPSERKTP